MNLVVFICFLMLLMLEISKAHIYTHTWAAEIEGGEDYAKQLVESHGFTYLGKIFDDHYHISHNHVAKRAAVQSEHHHRKLADDPNVKWLEQQVVKSRVKRDNKVIRQSFNDPKWPKMWYLNRGGGLDMNVRHAWDRGYRGKGIVVSILDDGIEKDHPDLRKNYDPKASYDVNSHDSDPQPRYDYTNENRHGTRCAGEVAAEANNGVCSVGAAYEAGIGGVRMLDGDVTDAVEAASLSLNPQHIDIYSASWGPDDDGRTVDGPARLAKKSFRDGIAKGRGGKGSIFVWASGNGGRDQDSCNCDGYTNSIFTLSISSTTESGHIPWYSEACSSTLSTTYSSGSGKEHQVVTTDLRKQCTETHTGTSASAPLAAGICALVLSANGDLTWRDMQHIVVMTSRPANLKAPDWVTNGVGRKVSHSFGFGLMDATAMVDLALNWTTVPPQHKCEIKSRDAPRPISVNGKVSVSLQSHGCRNSEDEVLYLEHVQALITLSTTRRGQVEIFLTSPQGTRSTLLTKRPRDTSTEGFNEWAFMTTHSWGEYSLGTWTLEVVNNGASSTLSSWSLIMFGTATDPLKDQSKQHPHSQDCDNESAHILSDLCVDKCPLSFYAANETTASVHSSTSTTTTSTTAKTTSTSEADNKAPSQASSSTSSSVSSQSATSAPNSTIVDGETTEQQVLNGTNETVTLVCKPCPDGCAKCIDEHNCLLCLTGYNMTLENTCIYAGYNLWHFFQTHISTAYTVVTISLCFIAILIFLLVFCILQLMEPGSCMKGYHPLSTAVDDFEAGNAKTSSKLLRNGGSAHYNKNGQSAKLLSSSEDDEDDDHSNTFNSKRMNNFS